MSMSAETLRELIKLIPPTKALKEQVERSVHLNQTSGIGDFVVSSYNGLHSVVAQLVDDSYVQGLSLRVPDGADDAQKAYVVLIGASQLQSYLEGQTGLVSIGGGTGDFQVQTAPNINVGGPISLPAKLMTRLLGGQPDNDKEADGEA